MLQNYLKIALRALRKQPGYTVINVAGLAAGIACAVFLFLFVRDERSYDRHHARAERIYRITSDVRVGQAEVHAPLSATPVGADLVAALPEVVQAVRFDTYGGDRTVTAGDRRFHERRFVYVDSTVFDVFTIPLLEGDPATALDAPFTVVLSEDMARKYFGAAEAAVGKTLTVDGATDYRVTGVMENMPGPSHFHFDFMASLASDPASRDLSWTNSLRYHTYVLLAEGATEQTVEAKLAPLVRERMEAQGDQSFSSEAFEVAGNHWRLGLEPLLEIHLYSRLVYQIEPGGDIAYLYVFSAVAVLVLVIACINFTNLATARAGRRSREVGVRKVLGAGRSQLVRQFLGESVLLAGLSLLLAVGLVELGLPAFNALTGKHVSVPYGEAPLVVAGLVGLALVTGLLGGSYPAFFLSAFRPVVVLKGLQVGRRSRLRSTLVVFQFAASIVLLVGTLVIYGQLQYVREKNLGFDREHVVLLNQAEALGQHREAFLESARRLPGVAHVAAAETVPGKPISSSVYQPEPATGPDDRHMMANMGVDYDIVETLGLRLVAGRTFSRAAGDSSSVVLNTAAVRVLGWDEAVGRQIAVKGDPPVTVIGVVEDFHFESLHAPIQPLVMRLHPAPQYVAVRLAGADLPRTLAALEAAWQRLAPQEPFSSSFLDADFESLYLADRQTGRIVGLFAGLAIGIACLGLFGLATFAAEQRTKEIGVRKVMGATVPGIVLLLSKEFAKLVAVAFVVAAPLSYFAMHRWLDAFAYRVDLSWAPFALAGAATLAAALLTVSYQAVRAALADPVEALRYE